MNYYMCPHCFNVYTDERLKYNEVIREFRCPSVDCIAYHRLFEIDELMIKPIQILNKKGYKTTDCCSGHTYEKYFNPYIAFDRKYMPNSLPVDWYKDDNCIRMDLRLSLEDRENLSVLEKQRYIFNAITSLLEWSDKLPNKEEI